MLIEPHRIFIARPHVQRDIVTTLFPCESQHILIKCGSDMSASEFFIHTEVIDIQRSDIGQDVVSDMLLEEGIKDYDAFLALTKNDEANVLACVVAKKFGVSRTIADVENIEYISLAEEMGVDAVINRKLITAGRIFKFTLSGKARMVRYMSGTEAEVLEYTAAPGSAITKAPLREISFPKDAVIGGVIRGTEGLIAVGDTQIEAYDHVAVFALPSAVKEVDKLFR